jgi:hypothetical protein
LLSKRVTKLKGKNTVCANGLILFLVEELFHFLRDCGFERVLGAFAGHFHQRYQYSVRDSALRNLPVLAREYSIEQLIYRFFFKSILLFSQGPKLFAGHVIVILCVGVNKSLGFLPSGHNFLTHQDKTILDHLIVVRLVSLLLNVKLDDVVVAE